MAAPATIVFEATPGQTVTNDHFGLNHVFEYEAIGDLPWEKFDDLIEYAGIKSIRYPGGTSAETVFDISNPNAAEYTDSTGKTFKLTPLNDFLNFCDAVDAKAVIVIPVAGLLTQSEAYGARGFDQSQEDAVRDFVLQVLDDSFPNPIQAFELGNEYEGYMTSAEYGRLSGDLLRLVNDAIKEFYSSKPEYAGLEEPDIFIQAWTQSVTGLTSLEELLERSESQFDEYSEDELALIDGIVSHFYARADLLDEMDHFLELTGAMRSSVEIMKYWEQTIGKDLDLMVSEWNVLHKATGSHGLKQASLMLEMFNTFLVEGVDSLLFWSAQYHPTSIANAGGDIMVAGQLLANLSDNVIGDKVMDVSGYPEGIEVYSFSAPDEVDVYIASVNDLGWSGELDLSSLGSAVKLLSIEVLSVDETKSDGSYAGQTGLKYWNEADVPAQWNDLSMFEWLEADNLVVDLKPFETLHIKVAVALEVTGQVNQIKIIGTPGWDWIYGNDEANIIVGYGGGDEFFGAAGQDTVSYYFGAAGVDADLMGLNPNDGVASQDIYHSIENLEGTAFSDQLFGNHGSNFIAGADGSDKINGRNGNDIIHGGNGWDLLIGGKGADEIDGGNGIDTAGYTTAFWRVIVDLVGQHSNFGDAKGDTLFNIENLIGSKYNDILRGDLASNKLSGGEGDDKLNGRQGDDKLHGENGDDILLGGSGADLLSGGSGTDTAAYWTAWSAVTADLAQSENNTGDAFGDQYVSIENLIGSNFFDHLFGNSAGNDITGGNGDDTIEGREGNDILTGGNGSDTFVFREADDIDFITDFGNGHDLLILGTSLTNGQVLSVSDLIVQYGTLSYDETILKLDFGEGDVIQIQAESGFNFLLNSEWLSYM